MKEDTANHPLWKNTAGWLAILTTLGVAGYTYWIFSVSYDPITDEYVSGLGLLFLLLLSAAFAFYIFLRRDYSVRLRPAWLMLGLGSLSATIAAGHWFYYRTFFQVNPFPNAADVFHGLYYPLAIAGLFLLIFAFVPSQERGILWLDLILLVIFFGIIVWYYLASPLFWSEDNLVQFLALAYPAGDFLILAGLASLAQRDLSRSARWILSFLSLQMIFAAAGDLLFAYHEINHLPYVWSTLVVLRMSSAQAGLVAAARQITSGPGILADPPTRFNRFRHLFRLALPYLAVLVGMGLLFVAVSSYTLLDARLIGILAGAFGLVAIVLWRQYVVLEENVRLYQKMRQVAWTDSLTGLYNRHFFNEILPREMERANRYDKQLSILLLDIDGFKKFNDTYGHLQGDVVLKSVARTFARQLRSTDTIARFGGDEFVVILPETNRRMAKTIAERIEKTVKKQYFTSAHIGVSIGITAYRTDITPEQFLDEADQDLYKQKSARKGFVEADEQTPAEIATGAKSEEEITTEIPVEGGQQATEETDLHLQEMDPEIAEIFEEALKKIEPDEHGD